MGKPWTEGEDKRLIEVIDGPEKPDKWRAASLACGRGITACKARYWLLNNTISPIAIIHCDYEELSPSTYKGMVVKVGSIQKRFFSKEPEDDLALAISFASKHAELCYSSSTVDNYFMDLEGEIDHG